MGPKRNNIVPIIIDIYLASTNCATTNNWKKMYLDAFCRIRKYFEFDIRFFRNFLKSLVDLNNF